ncbi:hypothetical protein AX769_04085 [Frondihabitans sp. PAMC 28766]|nr:hypothetical protein AX769_04085 [Frondihabitans sp. PAMC 28766]
MFSRPIVQADRGLGGCFLTQGRLAVSSFVAFRDWMRDSYELSESDLEAVWALPFDPRDVSGFLAYLATGVTGAGRRRLTRTSADAFLDLVFADSRSKGSMMRRRHWVDRTQLLDELGLVTNEQRGRTAGESERVFSDHDLQIVLSRMANTRGRGARSAVGYSALILLARGTGLGVRDLLSIRFGEIALSAAGITLSLPGSQEDHEDASSIQRAATPLVCAPCALTRWVRVSSRDCNHPEVLAAQSQATSNMHLCAGPAFQAGTDDRVFARLGRQGKDSSGTIRTRTAMQAVHWHLNRAGLGDGPYSLKSVIAGGGH